MIFMYPQIIKKKYANCMHLYIYWRRNMKVINKMKSKIKVHTKIMFKCFFVLYFLEKKKYRPRRETTCKGWALCDCRTRTNQQGLVYCKCMLPHSCLCHIAIQINLNSNLSEKVFYLEYNDALTQNEKTFCFLSIQFTHMSLLLYHCVLGQRLQTKRKVSMRLNWTLGGLAHTK